MISSQEEESGRVEIFSEKSELARLVLEAKEVDMELIRQLPPAYRYQFSRVRDDVSLPMEGGWKKVTDNDEVEEALEGPVYEEEEFRVWIEKPYMQGESVRGTLYCNIWDERQEPFPEEDVKISKQNISSYVNTLKEVSDCVDEALSDRIFRELYKLKHEARNWALEESSDSEHRDEREEIDVDEEAVESILEPSYLLKLMDKTDEIHVGDYILKSVASISAVSKNATDMALNLWSVGSSGAGKTHCFQTIFKTLPQEYKIKFNSCSPKALYYFVRKHERDALEGKVLLFNEAEAGEEAVEVLRSITDPNEENPSLLTVVDQQSTEISIEGSPVTWFTSVDPLEDEQLQNRFLFSNPQEGSSHKQAIADHQMENYQSGVLQAMKEKEFPELKAGYREIVESTGDLDVMVPFRWDWNRTENARLQDYFANMIFTLAKIHYRSRPVIDDTVVATLDDFYLAKLLWSQIEQITLERVKDRDIELVEEDYITEDEKVTRSELVEETGIPYSTVTDAVHRLMDAGIVKGEKNDSGTWEYSQLPDSRVAKAAAELEEESTDIKSVKNALKENLSIADEQVVSEGAESVLDFTPSVMRRFLTTYEISAETVKDVFEREEEVIEDLVTLATDESYSDEDEEVGLEQVRALVPEEEKEEQEIIEEMQEEHDLAPEKTQDYLDMLKREGEIFHTKPGKVKRL